MYFFVFENIVIFYEDTFTFYVYTVPYVTMLTCNEFIIIRLNF